MKKYLLLFLLLTKLLIANAQNNAMLSGTITGRQAKPVKNVLVHLLNTNFTATSNTDGSFQFSNIPVGTYTISFSADGFASIQKEIILNGNNTSVNIYLTEQYNQLDEIIVTAEKKEDMANRLPASITALNAKQVTAYRLWNSKELTAVVPNLYSSNPGDGRNITAIRGIATTSYDPAVTTYIDGVNQFSLDTYIGTLNDVERIEVLRGPQGTLYGRNALGGVINIITKQPTNIVNGFAEINFGNHRLQRYAAGIRAPLVKNKLFIGASMLYEGRNGYYTNDFTHTTFDKQHGLSGNYYLTYIPAKNWRVTLNAKHQNNRNNGAFPLVNGVEEALKAPFILSQNAIATMIDNTFNASASVSYTGRLFNISTVSAWQNNHRIYDAPLDGDFSPADAVAIINDYGNHFNNVRVFTQELRITSPAAASRIKYTAGAYFFHQYNPVKQTTHYGEDAGVLGVPDVNFSTINTSEGTNSGIALFGQINFPITKKLDLIAGLRYDYENKKLTVGEAYEKDGEESFVILPDTSANTHFNAVSPKLGLSFALAASNKLFITYNRGYRTGGLTQLGADPSQPPLYAYKPEYSNNIEAGIKNTFLNNRLLINITAFITTVTNAQVPTLILPQAIIITRNTGKLSSKGAELELSATPIKGLQINFNTGFTHARYSALKLAQNNTVADLQGKRQLYTPAATSMLAIQYNLPLDRHKKINAVLRSEWQYIGDTYYDLANTIKQPAYQLFNLRPGISTKHADIFFWMKNATGKKYIAYAYDFGAVHLGDPKTYGITASFRF